MKKTKQIRIDPLTRVEGEGVLYVKIDAGKVSDIKFKIIEPPRFFEALLRGRLFREAPDITARICGICPVAYQTSAVQAMEHALGVVVDGQLRLLRRVLYCGEWIESHLLHIFMLHAPDFLGYPDAMHMAKDHPEIVKRALELKKAGNTIIKFLGGREIHPVNVRVGGFYRVPTRQEFAPLLDTLKWARDATLQAVQWTGQLPFPDFVQDYEFVSLHHPTEYPIMGERLISNRGLDIATSAYEAHFREEQVPYSTALHSTLIGRGSYLTGPLARYNLNFARLSPLAQQAAHDAGLEPTCKNPFKSIIVRAVEVLYAFDEAVRLIEQYERPDPPALSMRPRAATGMAITEAPRGILYQRYQLDDEGRILTAKIVPPTAQNQRMVQEDLWQCVAQGLDMPEDALLHRCEQTIRNYDPCISCSTHFLRLHIERS
ncbi:MAG TPA: Ni/Fe hydrogenase subunit alpha [Ktedonobacteraceae bacterium]|jgi:coenzyme F420-reducing hydrogenase alpha subunit|nr:Ni/Fe hydrogenase subunit alpha [Ktedonobacteraceae bacterium]